MLRARWNGDYHARDAMRLAGRPSMSTMEPTPEQLADLAARPADQPVVMVNLLTFKLEGGRDGYLAYAAGVVPHVQRVGATVRFAGESPRTVIGDGQCPG